MMNNVNELFDCWYRVLLRLRENNLTLSPTKTYICPKYITILGWDWMDGTLSPNTHHISALASVSFPKTCNAMRSFIGGVKAVSWCIPKYASLLSPLENSSKGMEGNEHIVWTPELTRDFNTIQSTLRSPKTITIPKRSISRNCWCITIKSGTRGNVIFSTWWQTTYFRLLQF